jgi:hypothetical protein
MIKSGLFYTKLSFAAVMIVTMVGEWMHEADGALRLY